MEIQKLLNFISIYIILVPLILGTIFYVAQNKIFKLLLFSILFDSFAQLFRGFFGFNEYLYVIYNADILIQFTIFYLIFYSLTSSAFLKKLLKISLFASYIFGVFLIIERGFQNQLLSQWISFNNFIYVVFILFKCYESLKKDDLNFLDNKALVVFLLGLFLYSSCTLLIFAFWNYIKIREMKAFSILWVFHDILNAIMYLCYSFSFIYNKWKMKYS